MAANENLHKAKDAKNDEFYTQLTDIEKELMYYKAHFRNKIVLCNCDDPEWSAFWKYFHLNFEKFGLKKLISTYYDKEKPTYKMEYDGGDDNDITVGVKIPLVGNGDFRSQECLDILDECDIVCTNEPFSLFREYVAVLMEHDKKFLIIGNKNAITYKEFFPLLKDNKVWIGCNNVKEFLQPDGSIKKFGNIGWFTNLDIAKRYEKLVLCEHYAPEKYSKYDNYMAWNVNKVSKIPCDDYIDIDINESELDLYKSVYPDLEILSDESDIKVRIKNPVWGVPITFMDKYNPMDFEIVGADEAEGTGFSNGLYIQGSKYKQCYADGKRIYKRIFIRKR